MGENTGEISRDEQFRFVSLLGLELENGDITLPSLPDVVIKIRNMLEKDTADFVQISQAVSVDPVLVSRLFVFANSAYYNRANVETDTLEGAIGRLGFEVVRNTAMSIAMKQLYEAEKHSHSATQLRAVWARGMKLSCMAYAVASRRSDLNEETAFLCGLMHEVGKLYIITKAEDFPDLLGNPKSMDGVFEEWNAQISKSIIESWGFPDNVIESADPHSYADHDDDAPAQYADVMLVTKLLIDSNDAEALDIDAHPSCAKLGIDENVAADLLVAYRDKLKSMQQSLA
ncbi:MAG: HDOD domain-containing protein [Woeseiaceae bacterium]|nr:HDOD domain-containing protein [Woeseiaceae bacterium]